MGEGGERIIKKRERQAWVAREGKGKTEAAVLFGGQVWEAGGRVRYLAVETWSRGSAFGYARRATE
jgi:hypothetical protein